jgi:hypothetical protein
MMDELFRILPSNIHFNVTELCKKTWNQNWEVPEGLISIVGLKNGKKPVFHYGVAGNCRKKFILKKGTSNNGNKFINARLYFEFDRNEIIGKEKYVVANGFNGLLLCIKISKEEFINTFKKTLLEEYNKNDEHTKEVLERMKDRNMFESIEESAQYIANRDYNWLIGRLKYKSKLFNYSGQGYWLLPLKTKMEITPGFVVNDNKIIIDLEDTTLFENYLIYVDTKNSIIRYNGERLCTTGFSVIDEIRKQIDDYTCPWCGGRLKMIKTKKGEFLGCSNYPGCLYRRFLNK